jgi:crotonobetainyl-CoA:carnitine CoA-transferase CaiB-like acyl-CoA transferase
MNTTLLEGVRVITLGSRTSVEICAKVLAQAGATISAPGDAIERAIAQSDILVLSSDTLAPSVLDMARQAARAAGSVMICDITGAGPTGPYARAAHTDAEIQAITGLLDTTGFPDDAPAIIGLPYCEISAGLYAASTTAAALLARRREGLLQDVEVSLYSSATNALTTFLPQAFAGKDPHRLGNRHSSAAPWNAYRTCDGWVLICTSTQDQWRRLAALLGQAVTQADAFAAPRDRIANAALLDRVIGEWAGRLSTTECLAMCAEADIPAGPILTVDQLQDEPNACHRAMLTGHPGAENVGEPFRVQPWRTATAAAMERPGVQSNTGASVLPGGPLQGVRVVEIGQYTTAPLVGKHLAALGAEVIKIEPPGGDPTREWPYGQGDTSYFFALSNADKSSRIIDLKTEPGRTALRDLLSTADVFVENLRPGAMKKLGFGTEELAHLNPSLIHCAISGFGADSAYPGRPAFDTVIQAMSGIMDLTKSNGAPAKAGVSAADILSGQMALFCICATLLKRDETGIGAFIDLAMQDVAIWATMMTRNSVAREHVVRCHDGYLLVTDQINSDTLRDLTRVEALRACQRASVRAVPILSVAEVTCDAHFRTHALGLGIDAVGRFWPVLSSPYRLSRSPITGGRVPAAPRSAV